MNCSVSFSIGKVTTSYQTCNHFRDAPLQRIPFDITISRNNIPLPVSTVTKSSECLFIRYECVSGCDARVSPVLDVIACGLPTLVWLTISRHSGELSWVMPRLVHGAVWASGYQSRIFDPSPDVDGTCISIPSWSRQHVILTWCTGPILVCPPIHATSSESGLSRDMYTLCRFLSYLQNHNTRREWLCSTFQGRLFSWIPQIRRLTLFVSHWTILQIFDDEHAVGHLLLEHSSLVSVLKSPLLAVPTFEITDRSLRRIFPHSSVTR